MEVLPVSAAVDERWAAVVVACICLPMGTLINVATAAAILFDFRRMGRFKPTLLFLFALILLNQCAIVHLAFQVERIYGGGNWRWGNMFCSLNYGTFPLHQSTAYILGVFAVVGLSEANCHGLKHTGNNVIILVMGLLSGLLNSLHSFTDFSLSGPSCRAALSEGEPFWLLFATLIELLLFFLPTLTVALVFHFGDIRGNPRLPFASWASGSFVALQWSLWTPKYALILASFLSRALAWTALDPVLPPLRLFAFYWYLIGAAALYPVCCLLFYIVIGHVLLNDTQLSQTNAKYYDHRPKIYHVSQIAASGF